MNGVITPINGNWGEIIPMNLVIAPFISNKGPLMRPPGHLTNKASHPRSRPNWISQGYLNGRFVESWANFLLGRNIYEGKSQHGFWSTKH